MNETIDMQFIALIIPLILVDIGLKIYAMYDLVKTERVDNDRKWIWAIVVLVISLFGPLLYFVFGHKGE